jgi:predicted nuclease of predicted toxin-antitoxin system
MKFYMDENVPRPLAKALKQAGHETINAPSGYDDFVILQLALEANAVVITHDQDFERIVLIEKRIRTGVIWLHHIPIKRFEEAIAKVLRLVKTRGDILTTTFVTLSLDQTEIVKLK